MFPSNLPGRATARGDLVPKQPTGRPAGAGR
jgi:hypothetical protein